MKILWLTVLAALIVACQKNSDTASTPIEAGEVTPDTVVQHNIAQCPAWDGQFVNTKDSRDVKRITTRREAGNRIVLVEDKKTFVVSGALQPMPHRSGYVASCSQGKIVIRQAYLKYDYTKREGDWYFDSYTVYSPSNDGLKISGVSRVSQYNWEKNYKLRRGPGAPRPPRRR